MNAKIAGIICSVSKAISDSPAASKAMPNSIKLEIGYNDRKIKENRTMGIIVYTAEIIIIENPSLSITLRSESDPDRREGARSSPEERDRMSLTTYPCRNNAISTTAIREVINNTAENGFKPLAAKEIPANIVATKRTTISTMNKEKNSTILRLFVTYFSESMIMNMICEGR